MPKLKFSRTEKLDQRGRCSQLLLVTVECPWPFSTREVVLDALAFDDIDESGVVAVLLNSCDCEDDERVRRLTTSLASARGWIFTAGFVSSDSERRRRVEESERNTRRRDDCFVYF